MNIYYEAFDGTKFIDEDECLEYERIATLKEEMADGSTIVLDDNFEILNTDKMNFGEIIDNSYYIKIHTNTILSEEICFDGIDFAHGDLFYYYNNEYGKFMDLGKEVEYKKSELAKLEKALNILKEKNCGE